MRRRVHRKHFVAAIGLLGIFLATIAYLYGGILDGSLTKRPVQVSVELEETGGLFGGSGVTYRGVRVGKVESVKLDGGGSSRRSSSSRRLTYRLTARPPYVRCRLPVSSTSTSSPEAQGSVAQERRHGRSCAYGDADLDRDGTGVDRRADVADRLQGPATVLDELHVAFADSDDLDRILTSGTNLVDMLDESWPQTLRTLENARTVLRTGVDSKDQFVELSSSLKSLTASLAEYDPKLRTILDKTSEAGRRDPRADRDTSPSVLPDFLTAADDLTGTLADREPHLRHCSPTSRRGLQRLADTIEEGFLRVNMLVSPGEVCSYGVDQPSPRSTEREPVVPAASAPRMSPASSAARPTYRRRCDEPMVKTGPSARPSSSASSSLRSWRCWRSCCCAAATTTPLSAARHLKAATTAAVDLTTYDHTHLDRDFAWVNDGATSSFAKEYAAANEPLRDIITKLKADAVGAVVEASAKVEDSSTSRCCCSSTRRSPTARTPRPEPNATGS